MPLIREISCLFHVSCSLLKSLTSDGLGVAVSVSLTEFQSQRTCLSCAKLVQPLETQRCCCMVQFSGPDRYKVLMAGLERRLW